MKLLPQEPDLGWTRYVWLIYLPVILVDPVRRGAGAVEWVITIAGILVFLVLYFRAYWMDQRRVVSYLMAIAGLGAGFSAINIGGTVYFVFASGFLGRVGTVRRGVQLLVVLVVWLGLESVILSLSGRTWIPGILLTIIIGGINIHFGQVGRSNARLRLAQDEVTHLAKVAERERIARDLHDLLGHTLSVIILKSELASRIADRDPGRAAREIREVEAISREGLAQVRSAVAGYRAGSLAAELANLARTLETAGLEVETSLKSVPLTVAQEGVLILAVREGVTNIIRHANATRCRLVLDQVDGRCRFEIQDDGTGSHLPEGAGLMGMRERVEAICGTLERNGSAGTQLIVSLPVEAASPA